MLDAMGSLKAQRNRLVDQWVNAKGRERIKILVKIMDIEEEIKLYEHKSKHSRGHKIF